VKEFHSLAVSRSFENVLERTWREVNEISLSLRNQHKTQFMFQIVTFAAFVLKLQTQRQVNRNDTQPENDTHTHTHKGEESEPTRLNVTRKAEFCCLVFVSVLYIMRKKNDFFCSKHGRFNFSDVIVSFHTWNHFYSDSKHLTNNLNRFNNTDSFIDCLFCVFVSVRLCFVSVVLNTYLRSSNQSDVITPNSILGHFIAIVFPCFIMYKLFQTCAIGLQKENINQFVTRSPLF
jgi:hypothetical protein